MEKGRQVLTWKKFEWEIALIHGCFSFMVVIREWKKADKFLKVGNCLGRNLNGKSLWAKEVRETMFSPAAVDHVADLSDGDLSDLDVPEAHLLILTVDEMLTKGLELLGWTQKQLEHRKNETNVELHCGTCGASPCVVVAISEDLQTTNIENARIKVNIEKLHWSMNFMCRYHTEIENRNRWHKDPTTIRNACWICIEKISWLKLDKIKWPRLFLPDDIWIMSVDGTHLVRLEPGDSDIPKDPAYFSFKHHTAGWNYEVGIHLFESKCIWLSGPHKAGTHNDAKVFNEKGLRKKLAHEGKKAIADHGYRGFPNEISIANSLDSEAVREFKT